MTKLRTLFICLFALTSGMAWAQAGGGPNAHIYYEAISKAPVGSWAEYATSIPGRPEPVKIRYSLVEKTAKKIVVEIEATTPVGPMLSQMEFEPGTGAAAWALGKMHLKMGTAPAQTMPLPPNVPTLKKGSGDFGQLVGKSSVQLKTGPVACAQFKKTSPQGTVESCMSETVYPIGLVKAVLTADPKTAGQPGAPPAGAQLTTVLVANGSGAKAKLNLAAEATAPAAPAPAKPKAK